VIQKSSFLSRIFPLPVSLIYPPSVIAAHCSPTRITSASLLKSPIAQALSIMLETSAKRRAMSHSFQSNRTPRRIAMRIRHTGRLVMLCALILLPPLQALAAIDAYMTIKGTKQGAIKGDAMSDNIKVISVARDTPMATGLASGKRMHSTITITKKIDMASPKLLQAQSTNETLSDVVITFQGATGDAKTVQKIELTNAVILSVRKAGGNEQITFDYQSIEVTNVKGSKSATDDWTAPN
jgi:type VI secretion system secreted protein Hcp